MVVLYEEHKGTFYVLFTVDIFWHRKLFPFISTLPLPFATLLCTQTRISTTSVYCGSVQHELVTGQSRKNEKCHHYIAAINRMLVALLGVAACKAFMYFSYLWQTHSHVRNDFWANPCATFVSGRLELKALKEEWSYTIWVFFPFIKKKKKWFYGNRETAWYTNL